MEAGGYERVQTSLRLLIIISGLDSNGPVVYHLGTAQHLSYGRSLRIS